MSELALVLGALGLAGLYGLLVWQLADARADASQLRADRERRLRRLGDLPDLTARVGDLSEGTLSHSHAQDIARWIREDLP